MLFTGPEPEPGKVGELLGEPRLTVRVGNRLLLPKMIAKLALVVAGNQNKMNVAIGWPSLPLRMRTVIGSV